MLTKPKQGTPFRRDQSMLMNVDIDYDDELEKKNTDPRLLPNLNKEKPLYQQFNQTQCLDNQRRPIVAGVCWEPLNISRSLDLPILNQIQTKQGTTRYLLLNQTTSP